MNLIIHEGSMQPEPTASLKTQSLDLKPDNVMDKEFYPQMDAEKRARVLNQAAFSGWLRQTLSGRPENEMSVKAIWDYWLEANEVSVTDISAHRADWPNWYDDFINTLEQTETSMGMRIYPRETILKNLESLASQ